MPASITSLPFDILHNISTGLDVRSFVNLSRSNRHFNHHLRDEGSSRGCLQTCLPYPPSARSSSRSETKSSHTELLQTFDHWEAQRTAKPYSASAIAYASSFCYNQGTLVYSSGREIRVLDVHNRDVHERVFTGQAFINQLNIAAESLGGKLYRLSVLEYCDGVAVILCEGDLMTGSWLFAVDVQPGASRGLGPGERRSRFVLRHRITSSRKLFVRHNASVLYFGTCSAAIPQGYHEWLIQGFDLTTGKPITPKPIQLEGLVGSEVGATVAFTIHDGYFHAVTNQRGHESEEVDWTSYYQYIQFPVLADKPDVKIREIYRRQHREGPINDAFTNLELQVDQRTNELFIVECRKEWPKGGSTNVRSYYIGKLELSDTENPEQRPTFPANDPLVRTMDSCSNSRFEEEKPRIPIRVHRDYVGEPKYEYIRARTKYHTYSNLAHSFVDLVTENVSVRNSFRTQERILLRVASRIPKSPLDPDPEAPGQYRIRGQTPDLQGNLIEDSEEDFQQTEIFMWPPENAPEELFDILNPGARSGNVRAFSDDRSIVYMVGTPQGNSRDERTIVMISFDPTWGFEGMKRWTGGNSVDTIGSNIRDIELEKDSSSSVVAAMKRKSERALEAREDRVDVADWSSSSDGESAVKKRKRESISSGVGSAADGSEKLAKRPRQLWMERAMYLSLRRGFWLR